MDAPACFEVDTQEYAPADGGGGHTNMQSWQPADARPAKPLPCRCAPCTGFRCCCSPMFIVVLGIIGVNYGPYVLWVQSPTSSPILWSLSVTIFHVLVLLLLISYFMCVFTDPGTVPIAWHRMVEADETLSSHHRFCRRSNLFRPLRSHYCSVTRRVVLNMDHFCPWVINTVGFYNRKFFVLFLMYTLLATSWVLATSLPLLLELKRTPGAMRALERRLGSSRYMAACMAVILDTALIIMLSCFCPFHFRMVLLNETTIEGPSPDFHVGKARNWRQVMGSDPWLWFLPVYGGGPEGDGVHWPSRLVKSHAMQAADCACGRASDAAGRRAVRPAQEKGPLLGRPGAPPGDSDSSSNEPDV